MYLMVKTKKAASHKVSIQALFEPEAKRKINNTEPVCKMLIFCSSLTFALLLIFFKCCIKILPILIPEFCTLLNFVPEVSAILASPWTSPSEK